LWFDDGVGEGLDWALELFDLEDADGAEGFAMPRGAFEATVGTAASA
jgi:hypothetical protein